VRRWLIALCGVLLALASGEASAQVAPAGGYPVGIRQIEFLDGERHLALAMFYPAVIDEYRARPFVTPFFRTCSSTRAPSRRWAMRDGRL
jgi:hypothetical protein